MCNAAQGPLSAELLSHLHYVLPLTAYHNTRWFPSLTMTYDNNGLSLTSTEISFWHIYNIMCWFPNLTRAYDNNGRCPRQKFVFGILQLLNTCLIYNVFIIHIMCS